MPEHQHVLAFRHLQNYWACVRGECDYLITDEELVYRSMTEEEWLTSSPA